MGLQQACNRGGDVGWGNLIVVDRCHNRRHEGWQGAVRQGWAARQGRVVQGNKVGRCNEVGRGDKTGQGDKAGQGKGTRQGRLRGKDGVGQHNEAG